MEAVTYRVEAHTNADDATRYRSDAEVEAWRAHDPIALLEAELTRRGLIDDEGIRAERDAAERMAADLRDRMNEDAALDPMDLFANVYAQQTAQLREQAAQLRAELAAEQQPEAAESAVEEPAREASAGEASGQAVGRAAGRPAQGPRGSQASHGSRGSQGSQSSQGSYGSQSSQGERR
ncbi:hypothetical protein ADK38_40210 [Streptomyces varsoviensis]|uniref:2-oxoisovalerate dehydrogenase subunit alpha n=1 Tax=Streptomyces varsoviensis TaxID=67373 RepID=A0ABR5IUH4_9ACTN|nr:hypothetical protein ADK38_40210 [Streptomyces varsoviensis]